MRVILARCEECGVAPVLVEEKAEVIGHTPHGRLRVHLTTAQDRYEDVTLALRGRHQIVNALTAVNLAETLREQGLEITNEAICVGLETARHDGRLEYHEGAPPMLYDGAHNEQGAQALHDYLQEFARQPVTLVFGSMRDKKMDKIAPLIFPHAAKIILTQPGQPRAATPEALAESVPENLRDRVLLVAGVKEAIQIAQEITPPDGLILVTGSLYLVGEALAAEARA
jgi:dihydrofolate synthase/folylpolyglutamate synthase